MTKTKGFDNAFFNFQLATVAIGEGDYMRAFKLLDGAMKWIDRTGRDTHMRDELAGLREAVSLKLTTRHVHIR